MNASRADDADRQAVAQVYSLLSRMWLSELDGQMLAAISTPPLCDALGQVGGVIPEAQQLDELAVEYCRLFVGPRDHLPPIQSVWQRAQLQSEITDSVRSFMDLFDYTPPEEHGEIPDHLGIELDIMSKALSIRDVPEAATEFFRRHLSWPAKLLQAASDQAESPFYRSLMRITSEFLEIESTALDLE